MPRVERVEIAGKFKRFGTLELGPIGADVELVVMLGPNGSGKSSVFDAFLLWARNQGRATRRQVPATYFESEAGSIVRPNIIFHEARNGESTGQRGLLLHVRTAHRNTPDVSIDGVRKQDEFRQRKSTDRMIETDSSLNEHYQRLAAKFLPVLSSLDAETATEDLAQIRHDLAAVQDAFARVMPDLRFTSLGDPISDGSFLFARDGIRGFRYENLSGGEKAAFDLLLDIHIAATELGTPLVCLDEPETHLNPAVQATVLTELLGLLPPGSQLWIATHSVGMIRRAFEIAADEPGRVAFLDFGTVAGPLPEVRLEPSKPSRRLLRDAMYIALDDLADLLAPEVLVLCEGSRENSPRRAWDERVYHRIFGDLYQILEFKSIGGKDELDRASELTITAPKTVVLKLRDCDGLTDEARDTLLAEDTNLRILKRRSLESYLVDDEVLAALVDARGASVVDALDCLVAARDNALGADGSAKAAVGQVFEIAKRVLSNTERLGENKDQFAAGVLAELIHPGMKVRAELLDVLNLPSPH